MVCQEDVKEFRAHLEFVCCLGAELVQEYVTAALSVSLVGLVVCLIPHGFVDYRIHEGCEMPLERRS